MPRGDLKAYGSVIARIPQDLLDAVKRYASQHRCSVSELIRDGLEMRLEAGEVPGRSTSSSADHGDEVLSLNTAPTGRDEKGMTEVVHTTGADVPAFDTQRYYLGKLRPRGHDYHGSGMSLRYAPSATKGGCVACDAEKAKERRARRKAAQPQEG